VKINSIVEKGSSSLSDTDKTLLQSSFDQAVRAAELAVTYDNTNYLNYNSLGIVYSTVGQLGVEDAYGKAIEAYKASSALNPLNPGIKLAIARVYNAQKNTEEARNFIKEALALKPDFIEALITISQIEKSNGNNSLALSYAENALSFAPKNKDLIDYVDSLKKGSSTSSTSTTNNNNKE
jgi:tetratricopeptide (TPR) repeat protein